MIQRGKKLEAELAALCDRNRDGSFSTQSNRRAILEQMANDLARANFDIRKMSAHDIKGRHVSCLLYTSPSPRDRTRSRMPSSA